MKVELSPKASKQLGRMDDQLKSRIAVALRKLAMEPPQGDIKALQGRDGYRMRIGQYRVLFDIIEGRIIVHDILPRGQAYKGGR